MPSDDLLSELDSMESGSPAPSGQSEPRKRRGRPPGSKNKPKVAEGTPPVSGESQKVHVEIPPELLKMLAETPLVIASVGYSTFRGKQLVFNEKQLEMCASALDTYLKSENFQLTPGWALVFAYSAAIVPAVMHAEMTEEEKPHVSGNRERDSAGEKVAA